MGLSSGSWNLLLSRMQSCVEVFSAFCSGGCSTATSIWRSSPARGPFYRISHHLFVSPAEPHRNLSLPYLLNSVHPTRRSVSQRAGPLAFLQGPEAGGSRQRLGVNDRSEYISYWTDSVSPPPAPPPALFTGNHSQIIHFGNKASSVSTAATHLRSNGLNCRPGPLTQAL